MALYTGTDLQPSNGDELKDSLRKINQIEYNNSAGGGGGNATAANQATQITAEQAILAQLRDGGAGYTPTPVAVGASASSTIPATASSWAFLLLTGTGTIGGVAAPLGVPVSGGALAAALAYTTASASSAFIIYEVPA